MHMYVCMPDSRCKKHLLNPCFSMKHFSLNFTFHVRDVKSLIAYKTVYVVGNLNLVNGKVEMSK